VELKATLGTLSEVTDNNDGTYSAELTAASTPGLSRITGKINGGDITTDPAEVQFLLAQ
jgi:hypothetical protein